jgi:hypothetical protein
MFILIIISISISVSVRYLYNALLFTGVTWKGVTGEITLKRERDREQGR